MEKDLKNLYKDFSNVCQLDGLVQQILNEKKNPNLIYSENIIKIKGKKELVNDYWLLTRWLFIYLV